jgi:hypothetical protein
MSQQKEEFKLIFDEIKKLMDKYVPPMITVSDTKGRYEIKSTKEVDFMGKIRDGVYFGGLMIHGGFVGFYYMPVYCDPKIKKFIKPELLKLLKGKSCFHIKKYDKEIFKQIKDALKIGCDEYKKRKWI